jgi:hypothetical protein
MHATYNPQHCRHVSIICYSRLLLQPHPALPVITPQPRRQVRYSLLQLQQLWPGELAGGEALRKHELHRQDLQEQQQKMRCMCKMSINPCAKLLAAALQLCMRWP